jgi:DNA polymerase sigma
MIDKKAMIDRLESSIASKHKEILDIRHKIKLFYIEIERKREVIRKLRKAIWDVEHGVTKNKYKNFFGLKD